MIPITLTTTTLALVTRQVGLLCLCRFGFGAGFCTARCRGSGFLVPGPRRGPWGAWEIPRSRGGSGVRRGPLGSAGAGGRGRLFGVVLLGLVECEFVCHFVRSVTGKWRYMNVLRVSDKGDVGDENERRWGRRYLVVRKWLYAERLAL
jgi:hypothetical protein